MQTSAPIWRFCQILIVLMFVGGSAGISASFTWLNLAPQYGAYVAAFFVALVLAMECLKPIAVNAAWQGITRLQWIAIPGVLCAVACVSASFLIELQVIARSRAAYVATETKADARAGEHAARRAELRGDLLALGTPRTEEELQPLIEAAERAAGSCQPILTATQRDACKSLPALKSEAARGIRAETLRRELAEVDAGGGLVRGQSPEAASLARVLTSAGVRVQPGEVDDLLALTMVVLMQVASSLCMVVAPLAQTGGDDGAGVAGKPRGKPGAQGGARLAVDCAGPTQAADSGETDADHERFLAVLRGSGGSVSGGQRHLAETFGMGQDRKRFARVARFLANNGRIVMTADRLGTTVSLTEKETIDGGLLRRN